MSRRRRDGAHAQLEATVEAARLQSVRVVAIGGTASTAAADRPAPLPRLGAARQGAPHGRQAARWKRVAAVAGRESLAARTRRRHCESDVGVDNVHARLLQAPGLRELQGGGGARRWRACNGAWGELTGVNHRSGTSNTRCTCCQGPCICRQWWAARQAALLPPSRCMQTAARCAAAEGGLWFTNTFSGPSSPGAGSSGVGEAPLGTSGPFVRVDKMEVSANRGTA